MKVLYHVSSIGGLTELKPHASTHGMPYVYATENPVLSLLWGSSKSHRDLDGNYGTINNGTIKTPYFKEAFKNSFKERFKGETCYIYSVSAETFEHKTGFKSELVSEVPVKVISCTRVNDLYARLQEEIKQGNFVLQKYDSKNKEYVEQMNQHILRTLLNDRALYDPTSKSYNFVRKKFPKLVKKAIHMENKK